MRKIIEICLDDIGVLISLQRLLMSYTIAQKIETNLIQFLTKHIENIKKDPINSPNKEFIDRLISKHTYPRIFDIDDNIYEINSFTYDFRYYPQKLGILSIFKINIKYLRD